LLPNLPAREQITLYYEFLLRSLFTHP
jgi:hypothetical protein